MRVVLLLTAILCCSWYTPQNAVSNSATYVGSDACKDCHETEYENYTKYSKKAHTSKSVHIMESDLTPEELSECYACHTTGYGKPGGFKSYEETPNLAEAGCEVCHGPGSLHITDGDPELIKRKMSVEDCETCHNSERVQNFNFKPLIFGGAH